MPEEMVETMRDTTVGGRADRPIPIRRALVTGASTGIGAATVRLLRSHGWQVVATARRVERLQALAAETGATTAVLSPMESRPEAGDYAAGMNANLEALRTALACK